MIKKQKKFIIFIISCLFLSLFSGCADNEMILTDTSSEVTSESDSENNDTESTEASDSGDTEETEALQNADTYIYVFVCGAVQAEGVYELPFDARADEALSAAGGFTEDAATSAVNLAATLTDGQQLYFPTEEEAASGQWQETDGSSSSSSTGETTDGGASGDGKVNINTADKDELMTLSGVGEVKAESIISYREANGSFTSTEDIMNVSGIGESLYQKIKDSITI